MEDILLDSLTEAELNDQDCVDAFWESFYEVCSPEDLETFLQHIKQAN